MSNVNKNIIIVENSKKLATYKEILDEKIYTILSSGGRIKRVLSNGSHKEKWVVDDKSKSYLDEINRQSSNSEKVYLAMDDDSNGEKLAWDIKNYIDCTSVYRIVPKEINKEALELAMSEPREIDSKIIDAQNTRSIVEKMVGRDISSMMKWWFKKEKLIVDEDILKNIGIGRVSAAALALIVEAEEKIDTFIPEHYKKVAVDYFWNNTQFSVKNKLKFTKDKKEELGNFIDMVNKEPHVIHKFEQETKDKVPPPPLNSIWLQRSASYQFQYRPKETMRIAKELYEGVIIDGKRVGLISYFKTNSLYLSDETVFKIIQQIITAYGENYAFTSKRNYKNSENENGTEAIHPVSFKKEFFPKNVKKYLSEEQYRIYEYIYLRTMATQMTSAIYDQSELIMQIGGSQFKAVANKLLFDGWKLIGRHWKDDDIDDFEEVNLPAGLIPGDEIAFVDIREYEVKERSPWRYGDGRFLTTLQKHNIANASFVSEITHYLESKKYIDVVNSMIYPQELGKKIYYFLKMFAPWLVDMEFVAKYEEDIKLVELGQKDKREIIIEYENLKNELQLKIGYMEEGEIPEEWLIEKAKKIATQKGQNLNDDILKSKEALHHYLANNEEKLEILGKCPSCNNGEIFINKHGYKCNNGKCHFMLWHNNIDKFLDIFSKHIPKETIHKYIAIALRKKKFWLDGLFSSKKDEFFDSFVEIKYNETYKNWSLSLVSFAQVNNNIDKAEYVPMRDSNEVDKEKHAYNTQKIGHLEKKLEIEKRERRMIVDEAKKDAMTRAFNRACFDKDIVEFFNKQKAGLSLAFIDGDKFKDVNDTYGHQAGDEVLKFLVNKMFSGISVVERGRVYRYGGEEFLILFVNESRKDVISCINKIREDIEKSKVNHDGTDIRITISAGVSFSKTDDTIESFIERADKAVYQSKENGRNRIEICN